LVVLRLVDPEAGLPSEVYVLDRNQVDRCKLYAVDGEVVHFTPVVTLSHVRVRMMCIAAARLEDDAAVAEPTRLALDTPKPVALVDDEVVRSPFTLG
jgi:hypothetical protein